MQVVARNLVVLTRFGWEESLDCNAQLILAGCGLEIKIVFDVLTKNVKRTIASL